MARMIIDPVTRIGGHLRIEADVTNGEVTDAWSSGTMFRGIELILRGRDPRDAWMFAERICGTCTGVHALGSVRAVERAFGLAIPTNARLVRNILAATQLVRDHVVQFYLAQVPDWVDAKAALGADPAATSRLARSLSAWPNSSADYFLAARNQLASVITSNQPGPFGNGYWGHPAYRLSPERDLLIMAHALEALDWQRRLMRIHALFGGRDPHPQSYLVGGVTLTAPWGGPDLRRAGEHPDLPDRNAPKPLSDAGLNLVDDLITTARTFVDQVFAPDVLELARTYPEWGSIGAGPGNYLSGGEFPLDATLQPALFLPAGRITARDLGKVDPVDQAGVAETVAHSWYSGTNGDEGLLHPTESATSPAFAGPALPLASLEGAAKYTWLKAPRYDGQPMEVGPLARMLVAYVEGAAEARAGIDAAVTALMLGPQALFSTLGRIIAKSVESQIVARRADGWLWELRTNLATGDLAVVDVSAWDPSAWPATAEGWSLGEGPRGTVGHWLAIRDGQVDRYQVVDATTWNASPRDAAGLLGPMEAALVGTKVPDPAQPLEVLRTVHSFDPCTACAVHAFEPRAAGPVEVHARRMETPR